MIRQFELVEKVKAYDPSADADVLNRAYVFAMQAHGAQTRASGDPYFSHPLEVAGILSNFRLDSASIATALLHDTLEDTDATLPQLKKMFGSDIADLVDGVTKLSQLELQSDKTKQAENFRKLLLAMSRDIRVLLVKLADRLHNMRTLGHIKSAERRARIARETMEIYAPLAERIGMQQFKDELEDLAFAELNPDAWSGVIRRLAFLHERGEGVVDRVMSRLEKDLLDGGVTAILSGREKTPYSIWRKMQTKSVTFEMLSDVMAFRAVVDNLDDCYQALGMIHGRYSVVPGRFKDYISTPKPNGYQSLHTSVLGPEGQRIELQIRTREMHEIAERGVAAHWQYKEQGSARPAEGKQYRWLQELLEILESTGEPDEFLEHTKLEMFQDQVFCFTPTGEVLGFPRGATVIDFAYAVHSEVGDHCVGAKVNGRMVPLRTTVENGDQVEILTSKAQTPSPEWEQMIVTGKARSRVRRFVHQEQRRQYIGLGKEIVEKSFRREHRDFSRKIVRSVAKEFGGRSADDVFAKVGEGLYGGTDVVHAIFPDPDKDDEDVKIPKPRRRRVNGKGDAIEIKGLIAGMAMHLAKCCYPLPGDRIVGIVTTGKGVTIHTIDCDTLQNFADTPERWLAVAWSAQDDPSSKQVSRLHVILSNEAGSLGDLATVIGRHDSNISNLKITHRNVDFFDLIVDIEVSGVRHLTEVIAALRSTPSVSRVERSKH